MEKPNPVLKYVGVPAAIMVLLVLIGYVLDNRYLLRYEAQASEKKSEVRWIFICKSLGGSDDKCYGKKLSEDW